MQPADRNEIQAIRAELDGLRAQVDAVGSARGLLAAEIRSTTPPTGDVAGVEWNISAVYLPFGWNGSNTQPTTTQSLDGRRGR